MKLIFEYDIKNKAIYFLGNAFQVCGKAETYEDIAKFAKDVIEHDIAIPTLKHVDIEKSADVNSEPSENNWHDVFYNFLASLTAITNGKQQYFEQDDGKWYSRISGEYLTTDEMIAEYLSDVKSFVE